MCRWLAYYGDPIPLEALLFRRAALADRPEPPLAARRDDHERRRLRCRLVRRRGRAGPLPQRPSRLERPEPARPRGAHLCARSSSRTSAPRPGRRSRRRTATRSGTGAGCSCTTARCASFEQVRRDLMLAIDPALFPYLQGSADSEVLFHLALTFGLEDDPVTALERMAGLRRGGRRAPRRRASADDVGRGHRRHEDRRGALFERARLAVALLQHRREGAQGRSTPTSRRCRRSRTRPRAIVSEPLGDMVGAWNEVPESIDRDRPARAGRALRVHAAPLTHREIQGSLVTLSAWMRT